MAFAPVFFYRLFRAPLEMFQDVHAEREAAERRRDAAEDRLRDKRHCQVIADALTAEYRYGVHEILHKPPITEAELPEWNQWVRNWNQGVLVRMRQAGCTPQDINHVETIAAPSLAPLFRGDEREVCIRMHEIRLDRVADVSTEYAQRAEELRKS